MSTSAELLENLLQTALTGVLVGTVYGLMCVGLGLIFSIMRVINFAQGEFLMLGMYAGMFAFTSLGLSALLGPFGAPVVAALLAGLSLFLFASLLHPILLARISGTRMAGQDGDGHYPQLTLTLGLSLILSNGGLLLFGATPRAIRTPLSSSAWVISPLSSSDLALFINKAQVLAFVVTVAIVLLVGRFIRHSRQGRLLRAAADNPEAATYMGIEVGRVHRLAFGLGSAITGLAGALVATWYPFQPYVGMEFILIMYAGVVLGGIGSISGAFWGGLTIGLVQQLSTLVLPQQLQNAAVFIVFLLVVLLRPQGLFGRSVDRA